MDSKELAKFVGVFKDEAEQLLVELEYYKVFSRDADGTIYNRRMDRESDLSRKRAEAGRLGGLKQKGSKEESKSASKSEATLEYEDEDDNEIEDKKREIDAKFAEFWTAYPREGRLAKKESRIKFGALVKRGELAEFIKGFRGYLDFLKHQKLKKNFDQTPMYAKTFINGRWSEFVEFKYEPSL